jgi:hypothetical protein
VASKAQLAPVVLHFEIRKLEPVRGGNDHHFLRAINLACLQQLDQSGQSHAGMRAIEHPRLVAQGRSIR